MTREISAFYVEKCQKLYYKCYSKYGVGSAQVSLGTVYNHREGDCTIFNSR